MAGYTQQTWNDDDFHYPVSAARMQHIEQAIYDLKYEKRNVKDFGALGSGAGNDTTAIADALADTGWPSNRAALFFPPGRYVHDGTLTIDGGGASSTPALEIFGPGAELYTTVASASPMVSVTNSIVSTLSVRFHDVTFYCNAARTAVKVNNSEYTLFDACRFTGFGATGIEITGSSTANKIIGCDFDNLARGLLLAGSDYLKVIGCNFFEQLGGTPLNWIESSNGGNPPHGATISGCTFYGSGATTPILNILQGHHWKVTGCDFFNCDQEAIWIGGSGSSYGHSIVGNTFFNGKRHDIVINGGQRNVVVGNTFGVRFAGTTANTFANVLIKDPFALGWGGDNIVVGNNSEDTASAITYVVEADIGAAGLVVENNLGAAGISVPGNFPSVASGATITVPIGAKIVQVTGSANITSVTAGYAGQVVTLVFSGTASGTGLTAGSNLKIGVNFVYTPDDAIQLVCDGTNWYRPAAGAVN